MKRCQARSSVQWSVHPSSGPSILLFHCDFLKFWEQQKKFNGQSLHLANHYLIVCILSILFLQKPHTRLPWSGFGRGKKDCKRDKEQSKHYNWLSTSRPMEKRWLDSSNPYYRFANIGKETNESVWGARIVPHHYLNKKEQRWTEWTLYFLQPRTSRRHVKISILRVVLKDADLIAILCMQS